MPKFKLSLSILLTLLGMKIYSKRILVVPLFIFLETCQTAGKQHEENYLYIPAAIFLFSKRS